MWLWDAWGLATLTPDTFHISWAQALWMERGDRHFIFFSVPFGTDITILHACTHPYMSTYIHTRLHMQLQTNEMFVIYPPCPCVWGQATSMGCPTAFWCVLGRRLVWPSLPSDLLLQLLCHLMSFSHMPKVSSWLAIALAACKIC